MTDQTPRHMSAEQFAQLSPERQEIEQLAERLQEREILACQSGLVSELLQRGEVEGFEVDEIANLYPDPENWTAAECRQWLDDRGGDYPHGSNPWIMGRADIAEELESLGFAVTDDETHAKLAEALFGCIDTGDWGDVDDWQDAANDAAEAAEIFEWWMVNPDMAGDLREIGEPVLDNGYGTWWGRTCTGQSMMLDGTLQRVAALVHERAEAARKG